MEWVSIASRRFSIIEQLLYISFTRYKISDKGVRATHAVLKFKLEIVHFSAIKLLKISPKLDELFFGRNHYYALSETSAKNASVCDNQNERFAAYIYKIRIKLARILYS